MKTQLLSVKALRLLRYAPITLFITGLLLASFLVYRSELHHLFFHHNGKEYKFEQAGLTVELSKLTNPTASNKRSDAVRRWVDLSIPLSSTTQGCEFLYAAAVYHFDDHLLDSGMSFYQFQLMRYMVRFKYNLRKKRCESKELYLNNADLPQWVDFQLIDIRLSQSSVEEVPRPEGFRLTIQSGQHDKAFTAATVGIPAVNPYRKATHTQRQKTFSLPEESLKDVTLLVQPYDNLKSLLFEEIQNRTARCLTAHVCGSMHAAVGRFDDFSLIDAFTKAEDAGIDVDLITNRFSRQFETPELPSPRLLGNAPWQWIRGSESLQALLPLHTKFIVFDQDLVVSSNANYNFLRFGTSRQTTLVYRSAEAAKIFEEIFSFVRTNLFYPLTVNLSDPVQILFNADRPRGYAASSSKPYVSMKTTDGISTNAYGILFHLIETTPGMINLAMSPITNGCSFFLHRMCLDQLLSEKGRLGELKMYLNAFFYLETAKDSEGTAAETFLNHAQTLRPGSVKWLSTFNANAFTLSSMVDREYSAHHERAATLGDRLFVAGSANWAGASTVNTIEVIQSPEILKKFHDEQKSFDEPYFVSDAFDLYPQPVRSGPCEFIFDRKLSVDGNKVVPAPFETKQKTFAIADLAAEFLKRNGVELGDDVVLLEPDLTHLQNIRDKTSLYATQIMERPLDVKKETFSSPTSYVCVRKSSHGVTSAIRLASVDSNR